MSMDMYSSPGLLQAEFAQLAQMGVPDDQLAVLKAAAATPGADLEGLWRQAEVLRPAADWPFDESGRIPDQRESIAADGRHVGDIDRLKNKMLGGVLGRGAGMMLGKPLEGQWPARELQRFLKYVGAWPLRDYVPLPDPWPEPFTRTPWSRWGDTTRGNIRQVVQDDDIEYMIAACLILEGCGFDFTPADVGRFWLDHFAYHRVFTAERIVYRHLVNGVPAEEAAARRNPYREWIGAQIRADVYGFVSPGQPARAAWLAAQDARLSHTGNGVYGAMWVAAMVAAAFVRDDPLDVIQAGLSAIPADCRLAAAVRDVTAWSAADQDWETTWARIDDHYGRLYGVDRGEGWIHVIPNACLVALGLLYGGGDFSAAIGSAVAGGYDTDCNGATVGSIMGVLLGANRLPAHWIEPLGDQGESYIPGWQSFGLSAFANRLVNLALPSQTPNRQS